MTRGVSVHLGTSLYVEFLSYFTLHFISVCQCICFSPGVHVCMSLSALLHLSLFLFLTFLASLYSRVYFSSSLSPISLFLHTTGSLSPPFSTSPWILSPLPFPHLSHGRSPSDPGLRQRRTCWGGTREHRVHCRSSPTPLRYSHIGALWAVCLGRRASDQPLLAGRRTPQRDQTHPSPELTIHQPTPAGNQAGIPPGARALGGDADVLDGIRRGHRFFQLDEHEVVGERWFVVLWVLDGEVGFYHLTAWFLVGLKTVQAQPNGIGPEGQGVEGAGVVWGQVSSVAAASLSPFLSSTTTPSPAPCPTLIFLAKLCTTQS